MSEVTPMKSYQHECFNRSWTRTRHANIMEKAQEASVLGKEL